MRALIIAAIVCSLPSWALAYGPHVGDRAADIYGRDIHSGQVIHLSDYLGQWVIVEFAATW